MARIKSGPAHEPDQRTPRKPVKEGETYMSEGLAVGLALGVAEGVLMNDLTIGMSVGMMLGLLVGTCIKKKPKNP